MQFLESDVNEMLNVDEPYEYPPEAYDSQFTAHWSDVREIKWCARRVMETGRPQLIKVPVWLASPCDDLRQPVIILFSSAVDVLPRDDEAMVVGHLRCCADITPLGLFSLLFRLASAICCAERNAGYPSDGKAARLYLKMMLEQAADMGESLNGLCLKGDNYGV